MRTGVVFPLRALFGLTLAMGWLSVLAPGDDGPQRWVTTWTTANAASDQPAEFSNQTIREVVHTTIGGGALRIRLSNTFGTRSIRLDAVFVGLQKTGLQKEGAALVPRSNHEVTFGGSRSIAIPKGAEVALGDSITDGASSRLDKNERWTDVLGRRLLDNHIQIAVLNAGIGGNRVLTTSPCWGQNALARLGRDVLAQAGIEAVILFEGTNDIGQPDAPAADTNPCRSRTQVTADEIIAGYKQIIARTHARGLNIFGATILPYRGLGAWTAAGEAKRVAVNQWIRTSGAFDGIIDFDADLRDPMTPSRMAPQYDSGDHLHPGPAGHEAMGNAVDLALFR